MQIKGAGNYGITISVIQNNTISVQTVLGTTQGFNNSTYTLDKDKWNYIAYCYADKHKGLKINDHPIELFDASYATTFNKAPMFTFGRGFFEGVTANGNFYGGFRISNTSRYNLISSDITKNKYLKQY